MHAVSFSPSGDVLAFAGKSILFNSVPLHRHRVDHTPKVMTVPLPSSIRDLVPQFAPSECPLSLLSLSFGPPRMLLSLLAMTASLMSSPETKVNGSSSEVSTILLLQNPPSVLLDSALVDLGG